MRCLPIATTAAAAAALTHAAAAAFAAAAFAAAAHVATAAADAALAAAAASLESIGDYAFDRTGITGTIVTPFTVPAYNAANSFPRGVSILRLFFDSRLKQCTVAPSGTEPCWELADPDMTDIPQTSG